MLLLIVVILAVLGGTIFTYNTVIIPKITKSAEQKIRNEIDDNAMPKAKVAVVADEGGISKYTLLTDEIISKRIKIVEIPVKYIPQHTVANTAMLSGKITKEDLHCGEPIVTDSLSGDKKWFGEYDRLKEFTVSSIVAGEVKTGNIVDMIISYDNGDYDVVVPKIKVNKLVEDAAPTPTPEPAKTEDKNQSTKSSASSPKTNEKKTEGVYTLVLAVDEEQYRDLELASKLGRFVTRLYIDESQPPSKKTFDYNKALSLLNIQNTSTKTKTPEEMKKDQENLKKTDNINTASTSDQMPPIKLEN